MRTQKEERKKERKRNTFRLLTITSVSLGGDRIELIQRKPNHIRPVLSLVVIAFYTGIPVTVATIVEESIWWPFLRSSFSFFFLIVEKNNHHRGPVRVPSSTPQSHTHTHTHTHKVRIITLRFLRPGLNLNMTCSPSHFGIFQRFYLLLFYS